LLLLGPGIGAPASQLGAVTVSSVPDDRAPEVGRLQKTATNLGASIGNALAWVDGPRAALFVLALASMLGLFSARRIPDRLPGSGPAAAGMEAASA
jgi:hypothetical protein